MTGAADHHDNQGQRGIEFRLLSPHNLLSTNSLPPEVKPLRSIDLAGGLRQPCHREHCLAPVREADIHPNTWIVHSLVESATDDNLLGRVTPDDKKMRRRDDDKGNDNLGGVADSHNLVVFLAIVAQQCPIPAGRVWFRAGRTVRLERGRTSEIASRCFYRLDSHP
jgi:hypothetical protein